MRRSAVVVRANPRDGVCSRLVTSQGRRPPNCYVLPSRRRLSDAGARVADCGLPFLRLVSYKR